MFFSFTTIWPDDGRSIPAIMFRSVDLPEPDGPIRHKKPPASICRLASLSATTSAASRLKTFDTPRISTATIPSPLAYIHPVADLELRQLVADDNRFSTAQALRNEDVASHFLIDGNRLRLHFPVDDDQDRFAALSFHDGPL